MPLHPGIYGDIFKESEENQEKTRKEKEYRRKLYESQKEPAQNKEQRMQRTKDKETAPQKPKSKDSFSQEPRPVETYPENNEPDRDMARQAPLAAATPSTTEQKSDAVEKEAKKTPETPQKQKNAPDTTPQQDIEKQRERELREKTIESENQKQSEDETQTEEADTQQKVGGGVVAHGVQKLSAKLLQQSELHIITSFGLTLIYINIHFVGAYVAHSSWFCKFGEEWLPKNTVNVGGVSKGLEYVEMLLLFLVDIIVLLLIALVIINITTILFAIAKVVEIITKILPL